MDGRRTSEARIPFASSPRALRGTSSGLPIRRYLLLLLYLLPTAASGLFVVLFTASTLAGKGIPSLADPNSAVLIGVTAIFSHFIVSLILVFWAWKIRKSEKVVWVKGTEVLREISALYVLIILLYVAFFLHLLTPRWSEDVAEIAVGATIFFAVLVWTQAIGPGWTSYLEALESTAGGSEASGRGAWTLQYERDFLVWALLIIAQIINGFLLLSGYIFANYGLQKPREFGLIWVFVVVNTFLAIRVARLLPAAGIVWVKGTQAARQIAVANLTFVAFDFIQLIVFPGDSVPYEKVIGAVSGFLFLGSVGVIFGPGRSAHIEAKGAVEMKTNLQGVSAGPGERSMPARPHRYVVAAASVLLSFGVALAARAVLPMFRTRSRPLRVFRKSFHHQHRV